MIKNQIKKILPNKVTLNLMQFKHITKIKLQQNKVTNIERDKLEILSNLKEPPVLLAGYTKSGNTWLRFLIYNYFNVLNNDANKTLTYSELNNIYQSDSIGLAPGVSDKNVNIDGNKTGFPNIIRTHSHYKKPYHLFNKILFISRNPLDVLVSNYNFFIKNRGKLENAVYPFNNIDSYVLFKLPEWVHHYYSYTNVDTVLHITYEDLKENSSRELGKVLNYLGFEDINKTALIQSADFSSFDNMKKMGRATGEKRGMAPKSSKYKGEFTRKGKVGGYRDELKADTILQAKKILKKYDLDNKYNI